MAQEIVDYNLDDSSYESQIRLFYIYTCTSSNTFLFQSSIMLSAEIVKIYIIIHIFKTLMEKISSLE